MLFPFRKPARKKVLPRLALRCEALEARCTPAVNAFLDGNTLRIIGNNGLDDSVRIADSLTTPGVIDIFEGATLRGSFTRATQFAQIQILFGSGTDSLQLDSAGLTLFYHGGPGVDTLTGPGVASTWSLNANSAGEGNVNTSATFRSVENLVGGSAADRFVFNPGSRMDGSIDGGAGSNTLDYAGFNQQVRVSLPSKAASAVGFTQHNRVNNITHFIGSTLGDTLAGPNADTVWNITGALQGSVGPATFAGFETLAGGVGHDIFRIQDAGSVTQIVGGSGADWLDYSAFTGAVSVNLVTQSATGITAGFSSLDGVRGRVGNETLFAGDANKSWHIQVTGLTENARQTNGTINGFRFENIGILQGGSGADDFFFYGPSSATTLGTLQGNGGNDTLHGAHTLGTWALTSSNGGSYNGFNFSAIETLHGNNLLDKFSPAPGNIFTGNIEGGSANLLDYSAFTGPIVFERTAGTALGISGTIGGIDGVIGSAGIDTLVGVNADSFWHLTGANTGIIERFQFQGFENLRGGAGHDTFKFYRGSSLTGAVDGGTGRNALDYYSQTANVNVNLGTGAASLVTGSASNISIVIGGYGDDVLIGNDEDNALTGTFGVDNIEGHGGRDILSGGIGIYDELDGGEEEDIIFGGWNTFDAASSLLVIFMSEWSRRDVSFETRRAHLRSSSSGGFGGGLNGNLIFDAGINSFPDGIADIMTGGRGPDWFVGGSDDLITDFEIALDKILL